MPALDVLRLEAPVIQAGMGGVARHELAAAVSEAGGLGTIGGVRAPIADKLAAARKLTSKPIAVNLLLPFVRRGDAEAAGKADAVVTFWGEPRRPAPTTWIHQVGSVTEAKAAAAAGVDAVIAQGVEAGGHVRGTTPLLNLVERVLQDVRHRQPECSVLDLKAHCRGTKYVEETIKLLPERPEPVLLERIFSKIVGIGRIHAISADPVPA